MAKGFKTGGKQKGTQNKRTVQAIIESSQRVGEIKRQGQKKAVEVLNDLMQTAMSFAAQYQQKIIATPAGQKPVREDVDLFWKAMDSAGVFAKALAPYQDPQFRAIVVPPTPPTPAPEKLPNGEMSRLDDPVAAAKVYQQMMRRIA